MQRTFEPQTRVPGVTVRVNPDTLMPMEDKRGRTLWDMPAPVRYAEHTRRYKEKDEETGSPTGKVITEKIQVPVFRGTSAEYARSIRGQLRRMDRKQKERRQADLLAEAAQQEENRNGSE